jgi:hypothetical protein
MEDSMETLKFLWNNAIIKTVIMGAIGATGGIFAIPGEILLDKAHIIASASGAALTLLGLYTQHPTNPAA